MLMNSKAIFAVLAIAVFAFGMSQVPQPTTATSHIIQGPSLEAVTSAVLAIDGEITHELGIIDAVAALVTPEQLDRLNSIDGLRISTNSAVETAGRGNGGSSGGAVGGTSTSYPVFTEADRLHQEGITGWGVGVAVLDSGSYSHSSLNKDSYGSWRFLAQYDAIADQVLGMVDRSGRKWGIGIASDDDSGHGTHVQSVILSSTLSSSDGFNGVAPDAYLVSVKAFDANGQGSYADVIRGIDWVVNNSFALDVRVLNLSLSASPQSHYWDDPLNQAVMRAW
jgi:serine protease AprX